MRVTNEGLSLWYGTPDAPAPGDEGVVPRRGASLMVGVHPANPTNTVAVRYRVDGGMVHTVPGREVRTDYERQAQYFGVSFPVFVTGTVVEYSPTFSCSGRQAPPPHIARRFPSKFKLAPAPAPTAKQQLHAPAQQQQAPHERRFAPGMDFVAYVAVRFGEPQFVGDTAAGVRVNFFVREGVVEGNSINGTVTENSADHLIVRRDGVGVIRIRAAFAMSDGGRLDVEAGGYVDFGADGYRRALAQDLPDRAPIVVSPLISTRHPRYRWLSRVQCVGVGYTNLDAGKASYHIYAASSRALP